MIEEFNLMEYDLWIIMVMLIALGLLLIFGFNSMVRKGFNDDTAGYKSDEGREFIEIVKRHDKLKIQH